MTDRDHAEMLSWASGQLWAMEAGALERLTSRLATRAAGPDSMDNDLQPGPQRLANGLAILRVAGIITHKRLWITGTALNIFTADVNAVAADPAVRGIVIIFDSPGGTVGGVAVAAAAIRAARMKKPVVAIVDDMAASAAFWLATQASKIIIAPGGNTGSLGVFALYVDLSEALKKAGIRPTFISSSAEKVEMSGLFPLSAEAKAATQREVDIIFDDFVADVARGRGVVAARVKTDFGLGRLVNARDALRHGLVDGIASLDRALKDAAL